MRSGERPRSWDGCTEPRIFNTLGQTRVTVRQCANRPVEDLEYRYAAGQNNGRITQRKDWVSGEEVSYSYDTLNRLIQAVTTGLQYGLNFSYDGFGNLTQEQVFKGTGYNMNLAHDGATNRIATPGYGYDGNGNLTAMPYLSMSYDVQNRLIQTEQTPYGTMQYGYSPGGQRVWKRNPSSENFWFIDYYGADGKGNWCTTTTLNAAALQSVSLPSSVRGGRTVTGRIYLSGVAAGPCVVSLANSNPTSDTIAVRP